MNNLNLGTTSDKEFIEKLKDIVLLNLSDEDFGVNELIDKSGLNSSFIRHRLKTISKKTINQFINEIRLKKALEFLQNESLTASEVAYKVGFGSPAYFNNCFHEYFGYSPGEAKKRASLVQENHNTINPLTQNENSEGKVKKNKKKKYRRIIFIATAITAVGIISWLVYLTYFVNAAGFSKRDYSNIEKSIAVLQFTNLSGDDENRYFAYGVTENILNNLIKIHEIKVVSNPVKTFGENPDKFGKIARKLGIRFVLWGNVQRLGDSIQIIPKLTDINENQIIWSDIYERNQSDIYEVQSDIAIQVASAMQAIVSKIEKNQIERIPTYNQEAYNNYLLGRHLLENRLNRDPDTARFLTPFQKAIAADNNFAEAYAGLADVYLTITGSQCYPRPHGFYLARKNIQRAIDLAPDLAEAHSTLGWIFRYEWKWEEAREELEKAMKLKPNDAAICDKYAQLMWFLRNYEAFKNYTIKATALNPVSPKLLLSEAYIYRAEGNFEKALDVYNRYIEINPESYSVYYHLWDLYRKKGEDSIAVKMLQKAYSFNPTDHVFSESIPFIFKEKGLKGVEQSEYEFMIQSDLKGSWRGLARYCVEIGDKGKALYWIEKAWEMQIPNLPSINGDRGLDPLRNEPRFQAVIDKMGLTKYK